MDRRDRPAVSSHSAARICLGPYFLRCTERGMVAPGIEWSGWAVELAGDAFATRLNICQVTNEDGEPSTLGDFLVPVAQIPFRVEYRPMDLVAARSGDLLRLETVMTSLYRDHEIAKPLETFLDELHSTLRFEDWPKPYAPKAEGLLAPAVTAAGFELIEFWQYGATLHISVGWCSSATRTAAGGKFVYYAAAWDFRPTPARTLGKAKWVVPSDTCFAHLLYRKLRTLRKGEPHHWLSEAGHQAALAYFKWTKTTLLTRSELKQERIDFVRQHPELHTRPRDLARALRDAGLYNDHTELHAIVKQLPRMLEAASA